jgi:hypothetical protein
MLTAPLPCNLIKGEEKLGQDVNFTVRFPLSWIKLNFTFFLKAEYNKSHQELWNTIQALINVLV